MPRCLHCGEGTVGIGAATTIGGGAYGDESPEGSKLAIDTYSAPVLAACDADPPAAAMAALSKSMVGHHFAKCAVETALLDALGKRVGLSASELPGGRVRYAVPVLWTLASGDTTRDVDEAEAMIERRPIIAFKLKIGKGEVAEDIAHVAAIKNARCTREYARRCQPSLGRDERQARYRHACRCRRRSVEQPIANANRAAMARLVARGRVPVMADEALRGPDDAYDFALRGTVDVFAVKIEQWAGGSPPSMTWSSSPTHDTAPSSALKDTHQRRR